MGTNHRTSRRERGMSEVEKLLLFIGGLCIFAGLCGIIGGLL